MTYERPIVSAMMATGTATRELERVCSDLTAFGARERKWPEDCGRAERELREIEGRLAVALAGVRGAAGLLNVANLAQLEAVREDKAAKNGNGKMNGSGTPGAPEPEVIEEADDDDELPLIPRFLEEVEDCFNDIMAQTEEAMNLMDDGKTEEARSLVEEALCSAVSGANARDRLRDALEDEYVIDPRSPDEETA